MTYIDGDLIFSINRKKFGIIDIVNVDETVHPMYPGCEKIIRVYWQDRIGFTRYSSLYWFSTFELEVKSGLVLLLGNPTEQEQLALLIKYA